jgi:hypothetical protein
MVYDGANRGLESLESLSRPIAPARALEAAGPDGLCAGESKG